MAKEEVAKIQMEINHCRQSIRDLENGHHTGELELEEKMVAGISAEEHRSHTAYLKGLKIKIASEKDLLKKLGAILVSKQEELKKKSISRKVIEKLKDKQQSDYYEELDRQALKDADEMLLISRSFKEKSNQT